MKHFKGDGCSIDMEAENARLRSALREIVECLRKRDDGLRFVQALSRAESALRGGE